MNHVREIRGAWTDLLRFQSAYLPAVVSALAMILPVLCIVASLIGVSSRPLTLLDFLIAFLSFGAGTFAGGFLLVVIRVTVAYDEGRINEFFGDEEPGLTLLREVFKK